MSKLGDQVNNALGLNFLDPLTMRPKKDYHPPPWSTVSQKVGKFRDNEERSEFAAQFIKDNRSKRIDLQASRDEAQAKLDELDAEMPHLEAAIKWVEAGQFRMEKVGDSVWHKLRDFAYSKHPHSDFSERNFFFGSEPQVFLMQHNWAKAFEHSDLDDGDYRLPFDHCAFEFVLSGRRVIKIARQVEDQIKRVTCIQYGRYWTISETGTSDDELTATVEKYGKQIADFSEVITSNVRALCIALDAEVAVSEVIRAPHRLNMARERQGRSPLVDHRIVNLTHRSRVEPLQLSGDGPKHHKRMHFRRGHWRHFEAHKTWVRWCLVGNPDLGFIDKEYRA